MTKAYVVSFNFTEWDGLDVIDNYTSIEGVFRSFNAAYNGVLDDMKENDINMNEYTPEHEVIEGWNEKWTYTKKAKTYGSLSEETQYVIEAWIMQ